MTTFTFTLTEHHEDLKQGQTVYKFRGHDYGLVRDHNDITGQPHIAVTSHQNGDYPFTVVPLSLLTMK